MKRGEEGQIEKAIHSHKVSLEQVSQQQLVLTFLSRANNCWVVKGVRGFRLLLCFLRVHLTGGSLGPSPGSKNLVEKSENERAR